MAKVKLTPEQINYLKDFIRRKGFTQHAVVMEILDHFACKVEEVMSANPGIAFEDAVAKARSAFGVRGFQPISSAFEGQARKKYWKLYWANYLHILTTFRYLAALLASSYIAYTCTILCERNNWRHYYGHNDCLVLWVLLGLVAPIVLLMTVPKEDRKNYFFKVATRVGSYFPTLFIVFAPVQVTTTLPPPAVAVISSIFFLHLATHVVAQRATTRTAIEEDKNVERFYNVA